MSLPSSEGAERRNGLVALCYGMAFASGVAALVYEVAWARMLALTFGSTTIAAAAVVAGFLGGMGIGASRFHRVRGAAARPLLVYAWIELAIAVCGVVLSTSFYALPERFASVATHLSSAALDRALCWGIVLALLGVPAALMGATFPALCRVLIRSRPGVDRHLGWIYGINTLGAASGALLAGIVLLERLGLRQSCYVAVGINLAIAAIAFAKSRVDLPEPSPVERAPGETAIPTSLPRAATGTVLLLSGFCTLAYEILWFRGLRYLVGASNYAFSIVLFTFLLGLGIGALLMRRVARRSAPERDLLLVQCGTAVLALAGIGIQAYVLSQPSLYGRLSVFVPEVRSSAWSQRLLLDAAVAVATLLPATLLMGLSFPLATRMFLGDLRRLDAGVGASYLLANLGSLAGAVLGALILLPVFGVVGGTIFCAGINLLAAGVVLLSVRGERRSSGALFAGALASVVVLAWLLPRSLALLGEQVTAPERPQEIFFEEGPVATVQVLEEAGDPRRRSMAIDGYKIGWSAGFLGTPFFLKQIVLSDLPMALDRRIRRTLSIGLGSGATLKELSHYPWVEELTCVEINGAVADGARLFPESKVLEDPRARLDVEDAVHHLLTSPRVYDLIVSDGKQDPFFAGNADLLCLEFYRYARARMAPQGLLVQWFPLGTLPGDLRVIAATLCESFPHVDAFCFPPHSLLLVAGLEPLGGRPHLSEAEFSQIASRPFLAHYGLQRPEDLLARWLAGRERIAAAVAGAPASRWDRQILDVSTFKATRRDWEEAAQVNLAMLIAIEEPPGPAAGPNLPPAERGRFECARQLDRTWLAIFREQPGEALAAARKAVQSWPQDAAARALLDRLESARAAAPASR